jgi:hypothetical protein
VPAVERITVEKRNPFSFVITSDVFCAWHPCMKAIARKQIETKNVNFISVCFIRLFLISFIVKVHSSFHLKSLFDYEGTRLSMRLFSLEIASYYLKVFVKVAVR